MTEGDAIGARQIFNRCEKHNSGIQPGRKVTLLSELGADERVKNEKTKCSIDSLGNVGADFDWITDEDEALTVMTIDQDSLLLALHNVSLKQKHFEINLLHQFPFL